MPPAPLKRWVSLALAGVASLLLLLHAAHYRSTWTDDAYISFRYARRLWTGQGLSFNPGERFEGLTNLGWALLLSPLSDGDLLRSSRLIGLGCGVATVALLAAWLRRAGCGAVATGCALAALVISPWVPHWLVQGMETPLAMLLLTLGWTRYSVEVAGGRPRLAGWALGLGPWVRPDAALVAGGVGLWHLLRRGGPRGGPTVWPPLLIVLSCGLGLVATKLVLFGNVLPNTFYVKVTDDAAERGWTYLQALMQTPNPLLPALLGLGLLASLAHALRRDDRALPGLLALAGLLALIPQGGDFMASFRLVVPLWPALCAGLGLFVQALLVRARAARLGEVATGALALTLGAALWAPAGLGRVDQLNRSAAENAHGAGLQTLKAAPLLLPWTSPTWAWGLEERMPFPAAWTLTHAPDGASVAYTDVGLISWVNPEVAVVDLLGLTDAVMAGRAGPAAPASSVYLSQRLSWMILDTEGGAWPRFDDLLKEQAWPVVAGCASLWVFENPRRSGEAAVGPSPSVLATRVETLLRLSPQHRELQAAVAGMLVSEEIHPVLGHSLASRLRSLHGEPWWDRVAWLRCALGEVDRCAGVEQACGRGSVAVDLAVVADPSSWPAPHSWGGTAQEPLVDPVGRDESVRAEARVECAQQRQQARLGWEAASEAWAQEAGAEVGAPRHLARQAAARALLPREAPAAAGAARDAAALPDHPEAAAASVAAWAASETAEDRCRGLEE